MGIQYVEVDSIEGRILTPSDQNLELSLADLARDMSFRFIPMLNILDTTSLVAVILDKNTGYPYPVYRPQRQQILESLYLPAGLRINLGSGSEPSRMIEGLPHVLVQRVFEESFNLGIFSPLVDLHLPTQRLLAEDRRSGVSIFSGSFTNFTRDYPITLSQEP